MADEKNTNEEMNEQTTPTADERIAALEAQIAKLTTDNSKLKEANTKASADASRFKKELQAKQTDAERAEQEAAEREAEKDRRLAELERSVSISNAVKDYIAMGYTAELAQKRAEAEADGKFAEARAAEKEFLTAHDKELSASAVKNMGKPPIGTGTKPMTKAEIMAIKDPTKRRDAIAENIELFT